MSDDVHEFRFIMVMRKGGTHIRTLVSTLDLLDDADAVEMINRVFARKNAPEGPFFASNCVWERDVKHVDIMRIKHIKRIPFTDKGLKK